MQHALKHKVKYIIAYGEVGFENGLSRKTQATDPYYNFYAMHTQLNAVFRL